MYIYIYYIALAHHQWFHITPNHLQWRTRAPDFSVPRLLPDFRMKAMDICTWRPYRWGRSEASQKSGLPRNLREKPGDLCFNQLS